ncbi:hypothetical protein MMPV_007347 [Pyropia vietnamensis]
MVDRRPPSPFGLPPLGAYLAAGPPPPLLFPPTSPPTSSPTRTDVQAAVAAAIGVSPSAAVVPGGVLAVVLAGGQGSRFVSATPKVLVPFRERPLASVVVAAATDAGAVPVTVVGHAAEQVVATLGGRRGGGERGTPPAAAADDGDAPPPVAAFVLQEPRLGTGHAVGVALAAAVPPSWAGAVLVLCADTPGVDGALLAGLLETHQRYVAADARHGATVLTGSRAASTGGGDSYGRIVRAVPLNGRAGAGATAVGACEAADIAAAVIVDIVEKKTIATAAAGSDADAPVRTCGGIPYSAAALDALDEFNSGVVVADAVALRSALLGLVAHPTGGGRSEYYVTDFVVAMADAGRTVRAAAMPPDQVWRVEGANTVEELAALERRVNSWSRHLPAIPGGRTA